jgi:hypothetical protein
MTSLLVTVALFLIGAALCVGGYLFFKEAFYLLGLLAGLSVGVFALGNDAIPGQWDLAVLVVAPLVGLVLAMWIRTMAITVFGAALGFAVGWLVAGISVPPVTNLANPVLAAAVVVGIIAAFFLETPIMMFASASWGATLLTIVFNGQLFAGETPEAVLASGLPMVYWVLLVFGLGTQLGLWYYLRTRLDDGQTLKGLIMRRVGRRIGSLRN